MDTFGLKIIASDKVFYEGRCRKLIIPAPDGEKGILPNHENMVIAVTVGIGRMEAEEGKWQEVALGGGFAEIVNNRVTLIVDRLNARRILMSAAPESRENARRSSSARSRAHRSIIIPRRPLPGQ